MISLERDLPIPEFLQEDANTIHERMLEKAPPGVSIIEGDFFWDNTRPAAEEKAELVQMKLQNVLKLAFPQTSHGIYLEYLGECKGVFKNPATYATGVIKVKGKPKTVIEKGKIAGTPATDEKESIEFEFIETKTIEESGFTNIKAKCLVPGTIGNVFPNTITVLITPINGIESITNEEVFKGGTDLEDEEHYRERVLEEYKNEATSGNDAHYIKWAKEVDGVGYAWIFPEWNGAGTVKVLIADKNGKLASNDLINKVQKYIAPYGKNRGGKAPIGALVTVGTLIYRAINIDVYNLKATNLEVAKNYIINELNNYFNKIIKKDSINLKSIESLIINMQGVEDFSHILLNGDIRNVLLDAESKPILGQINFLNGDVGNPNEGSNKITIIQSFASLDNVILKHGIYTPKEGGIKC